MMLSIPLSPEQEARLKARASSMGKDVAEYVLQVVDEDLEVSLQEQQPAPVDPSKPDPWLEQLRTWIARHPRREHFADDSRESIYADRGE